MMLNNSCPINGSSLIARSLLGVALFASTMIPAQARPSSAVQDGAHVLSPETVTQVQQIDDEIFRASGKDLLVVTQASVSGSAMAEADNVFRRERLNGILIFLVPDSKKLELVPGQSTQMIFPKSRLTEIRMGMLPHLKTKDYDGGILDGARGVRTTLLASAPAAHAVVPAAPVNVAPPRQYSRPAPQVVEPRSSGIGSFFGWGFLVLLIGGIVIMIMLARFASGFFTGGGNRTVYDNNNYGQPGYSGGGGGPGLLGTLAAGVGGAVVGNALYDTFAHRGGNEYGGGGGSYGNEAGGYDAPASSQTVAEPAWTASDDGNVGAGDSSSFGDSSGGGGSSGGDASGGGGSSGGDASGGDWS